MDVGIVEAYAKNDEGKTIRKQFEVDFVVNQVSQRYYIHVSYDMTSEEKQKQEFNSLFLYKKRYPSRIPFFV